jgi:hypothetical protein
MLNPVLIQSYGNDYSHHLFNHKGENYRIFRQGGRVVIDDWVPDPVTPFDKQLIASITRQFFLDLELQRQSFLKAIAMEVFV